MKFKAVLPYMFLGSLMLFPKGGGEVRESAASLRAQPVATQTIPSYEPQIKEKAEELCNTYIDLVLRGQENIKSRKGGYGNAVRKELPGAPVGLHCMYGQYTQLNRALYALGDTMKLIPRDGRASCPSFRTEMRKKYSGNEYAGVIHSGKMFKSESDYNHALEAFLKHRKVTDSTPDAEREKVIAQFEKNNFLASALHPGAILIIQKSSDPNNTHAIMYLGRGRVENDKFVEDPNGKFIYAGYNNESIGDIFATYRTDHIFAADIYGIALVAYAKELDNIKNMSDDELFRFVYDVPSDLYAFTPNRKYLQEMATEKYFDKQNFVPKMPATTPVTMASMPLLPGNFLAKKSVNSR